MKNDNIDERDVLGKATPLIAKWEGFVPNPYFCSGWALTIGYGHIIDPNGMYGEFLGKDIIKVCNDLKRKYFSRGTEAERLKINDLISQKFNDILIEEDAFENLRHEIKNDYWRKIKKFLPDNLNVNQYAALTSFSYNMGVHALKTSTLLKYLNQGNLYGAQNEFQRWVYAKGKVLKGLINRRKDEAKLFSEPPQIIYDPIPPMRPLPKPTFSEKAKYAAETAKEKVNNKKTAAIVGAIATAGAEYIAAKTGVSQNLIYSVVDFVLSSVGIW